MAKHNIVGSEGETLAARFLIDNGYEILERNFRVGHLEIDIVARRENIIHFVEVKSRTLRSGQVADFNPEAAFTEAKRERLMRAAELYAQGFDCCEMVEFSLDLVAIYMYGEGRDEIKFYQGLHF